jgi:hypothetical protein
MKLMNKLIAIVTALSVFLAMPLETSAHQIGSGTVLGDNTNGWITMPEAHLNGTHFTYNIVIGGFGNQPFMPAGVIQAILDGANSWAPTITSSHTMSQNNNSGHFGVVRYVSESDILPNRAAEARRTTNNSGHAIAFTVALNPRPQHEVHLMRKEILAHEFGHVIGLNDLGVNLTTFVAIPELRYNRVNVMYGSTSMTATGPTLRDRAGARVITGQHPHPNVGHSFVRAHATGKSFTTMTNGIRFNQHLWHCSLCYAWQSGTNNPVNCTYNSNGICVGPNGNNGCGTRRNGDVTQTGGVYTVHDAMEILQIASGMISPNWTQYYLADVNGDGQVTNADAELILARLGQ